MLKCHPTSQYCSIILFITDNVKMSFYLTVLEYNTILLILYNAQKPFHLTILEYIEYYQYHRIPRTGTINSISITLILYCSSVNLLTVPAPAAWAPAAWKTPPRKPSSSPPRSAAGRIA